MITVAASGADDSKASFSNRGTVDVAAPGGGPDAGVPSAAHRNILSLRAGGTGDQSLIVGGSYLRQAGTSMATPHAPGSSRCCCPPTRSSPWHRSSRSPGTRRETRSEIHRSTPRGTTCTTVKARCRRRSREGVRPAGGPAHPEGARGIAGVRRPGGDVRRPAVASPRKAYNLGGGTMSWSAVAPDWLTVVSSSVTTPSFPSVTMTRIADATGVRRSARPRTRMAPRRCQ